jgi:hypothetical protein
MTNRVNDLLTGIAACLCAEVNAPTVEKPNGPMCFCGVIAGQAAVHDLWPDCTHDGMAWVRLALSYPSLALGIQDQSPGVNRKFVGVDIEIGMVRSYEVESDGSITDTEQARMVLQSTDDMMAMRHVIACCDTLQERDFILGTWTPIGPTGLVYGGAWTLYSQVV